MKNRIRLFLMTALGSGIFLISGMAQVSQTNRIIEVKKTNARITIDGVLDESAWHMAAVADSFIYKWPTDSGRAKLQTEIRMIYNDQVIYFGIKANMSEKAPVIQSLKRDVNPYYSDGVSVVIDPSGKSTSGYTFGVNAAGAQMDGIVEVNSASFDWDAKWYSATQIFKGYWIAELAIPFKSFRFSKTQRQWSINFIRNDMTNNCFSTWNQVPIQFFGANLNCLGKIFFTEDIPIAKSNNAFIPYMSAKVEQEQSEFNSSVNFGLDAKIAVNSSLNLDATINPDFSQVDVDKQIINLERFNVLLPERRTFFLENGDLFSTMGLANIASPFVSRRIGLTDDGRIVPIILGLRFTGNLNPSLRIGFMNIQSAKKYGQPAQNYSAAAFDHKVFKRSNLRAMITNRQEISGKQQIKNNSSFNRVAGTEFNFLSNNTKLNGRAGYYHSFNPGHYPASGFWLGSIGYTDKNINVTTGWSQVNSNFITDLGFTPRLYNYDAMHDTVRRIGYNAFNSSFDYLYYPKSKTTLNSAGFNIKINHYSATAGPFLEFNGNCGLNFSFANRQEAAISWNHNKVNLQFPTTLFPETGSLAKAEYNFGFIQLKYSSNFLRAFSWGINVEHGDYYNGQRTSLIGNIKYRKQPWGSLMVDLIYNRIKLNDKNIYPFIISPTIEIAFSNKLFWTTFLQYNTLIKNFNVNSRFQWRFKPVSDIFLVFTDNYITDVPGYKSKHLVLKINLWIN